MNAEQKRAWLGLVTGIACLAGFVVLIPFVGLQGATAAFAFYALNALAPFIGRKERADERDRSIARRASMGGFAASYLFFILGCMGVWSVVFRGHGNEQVSVLVLPTITAIGGFVLYFVRSIMILVLYGRHAEADNA